MSDNREQFRPEDHPNDHFLLTTVVGSYKKPKWLDRARDLHEDPDGNFDDDNWQEAADDASRLITQEHERSGLDVVCDGEMRRTEMVEYFAHRIDGYEFPGRVKVWGHNTFDKPAVVDDVAYDEPWLVDEFEFTSSVAERPVKVPITGPYTIARFSFNEYYDDYEDYAYALADLVNTEIENLVDAGARYIQIDEPALAMTPTDHAVVGEGLERIAEDIPDGIGGFSTGTRVPNGGTFNAHPSSHQDVIRDRTHRESPSHLSKSTVSSNLDERHSRPRSG